MRKSKDESYLDEQVDWLADAEWFTSSGLSASAAQTLYPRHSSSVFSPLCCLLFATPIPLPTLLSHDSLFLARSSSSSFRKSLKAFRSYPRRSFAASRGFLLSWELFNFLKFTRFQNADYIYQNTTRVSIILFSHAEESSSPKYTNSKLRSFLSSGHCFVNNTNTPLPARPSSPWSHPSKKRNFSN